jgi:hypothetical protein
VKEHKRRDIFLRGTARNPRFSQFYSRGMGLLIVSPRFHALVLACWALVCFLFVMSLFFILVCCLFCASRCNHLLSFYPHRSALVCVFCLYFPICPLDLFLSSFFVLPEMEGRLFSAETAADLTSVLLPNYTRAFILPAQRDNLRFVLAACLHSVGIPIAAIDLQNIGVEQCAAIYGVRFTVRSPHGIIDIFGKEGNDECIIIRFNQLGELWQYDALFLCPEPGQEKIVDFQPFLSSNLLEKLFGPHQPLLPLPNKLALVDYLKTKRMRVALIGEIGSGKSALINALVGGALVPEGVVGAATSLPTSFRYRDDDQYRVKFVPFSWTDLEDMIAIATMQNCVEGISDSIPWLEALIGKRIDLALWPKNSDNKDMKKFVLDNIRPSLFKILEERKMMNKFGSLAEAARYLRGELVLPEYVDTYYETQGFWPVLKRICVFGRFPWIPRHVELMDLPGLNDLHRFRSQNLRRIITRSDHIFILTRGNAAVAARGSDGIVESVLANSIGCLDRISIIATRMDDIPDNFADDDANDELLYWKYACKVESVLRSNLEVLIQGVLQRRINEKDVDAKSAYQSQVHDVEHRTSLGGSGGNNNNVPAVAISERDIAKRLVRLIRVIPVSANSFRFLQGEKLRKFVNAIPTIGQTGVPAIIRLLSHLSEVGDISQKVQWLVNYANMSMECGGVAPALLIRVDSQVAKLRDDFATGILKLAELSLERVVGKLSVFARASYNKFNWIGHSAVYFAHQPSSFQCALRGNGHWTCGGVLARTINLNSESAYFIIPELLQSFSAFTSSVQQHPSEIESVIFRALKEIPLSIESDSIAKFYQEGLLTKLSLLQTILNSIPNEIAVLCRSFYSNFTAESAERFVAHLEGSVLPQLLEKIRASIIEIWNQWRQQDEAVCLWFRRPRMNPETVEFVRQLNKMFEEMQPQRRVQPSRSVVSNPPVAAEWTAVDRYIAEHLPNAERVPIVRKGFCLFQAAAMGLGENSHELVRHQVVEWLSRLNEQTHPEIIAAMAPRTLAEYLTFIREEDAWGGEPELIAIATIFKVTVVMIRPNGNGGVTMTKYPQDGEGREIYLAYNGTDHYDAIVWNENGKGK